MKTLLIFVVALFLFVPIMPVESFPCSVCEQGEYYKVEMSDPDWAEEIIANDGVADYSDARIQVFVKKTNDEGEILEFLIVTHGTIYEVWVKNGGQELNHYDLSPGEDEVLCETPENPAGIQGELSYFEYCWRDVPVAIELYSFSAQLTEEGALIQWETAEELNCAGFFIYKEEDGEKIKVNDEIIFSQSFLYGSGGYSYEFIDENPGQVYWLAEKDLNGMDTFYGPIEVSSGYSSVVSESKPNGFSLEQNYPNPFNPTTTIEFSLKEPGKVNLSVYNVTGQKVATLIDGSLGAGSHTIVWNATQLPTGTYFYKLQSGAAIITRKMTISQ